MRRDHRAQSVQARYCRGTRALRGNSGGCSRYRSRGRLKPSVLAEVASVRGGSGRSKQAAGSDESSPTAIGHRLRRQAALLPSSLVSSRSRLGRQTVIPRACESETSGGLASHNPRAPRPICCALGHAAQTQRRARCTGSVRMNAGPGRPRKTCGCPAAATGSAAPILRGVFPRNPQPISDLRLSVAAMTGDARQSVAASKGSPREHKMPVISLLPATHQGVARAPFWGAARNCSEIQPRRWLTRRVRGPS